jgi:Zn-dependent protease with chaperone function
MEKPMETGSARGPGTRPILLLLPLLAITIYWAWASRPMLLSQAPGWLLPILAYQLAVLQGPVLRPLLLRWTRARGALSPAGVAVLPFRGLLPRAVPASRLVLVPAALRQWLAPEELDALVDRERAGRERARFPVLVTLAVLSTSWLTLYAGGLQRTSWIEGAVVGGLLCLVLEGFRFSIHRLLALDADAAVPERGALGRALEKLQGRAGRFVAASLRSRLRRLGEPEAPPRTEFLVRLGFLLAALPLAFLNPFSAIDAERIPPLELGLLLWLLYLARTEPADLGRVRVLVGSLATSLLVGTLVILALWNRNPSARETVFCGGPLALLLALRLRDPVLAPLLRLGRARRRLAGPAAGWLDERSREALDHPLVARLVPVPGGRDFSAVLVPGTRTVLVAEPLEGLLSEAELRALLAREVGRAARRHPTWVLALAALEAAAFVAGYALAPGMPAFRFLVGWAARLPVALLAAGIEERMVFAAVDFAARATSPADLASALGTLSRWGGRSVLQRLSTEPGRERRLRRLAPPA